MSDEEKKTIEKIDFVFDIIPQKNRLKTAKNGKDNNYTSDDRIKGEVVTYEGSNKVTLKKRLYIGFKTRVTILATLIVILMLVSGISFLMVYLSSKNYDVKLSEKSDINYLVCTDSSCIDNKDIKGYIASNCDIIKTNFIYNLDISDRIKYNLEYYIDSEFIITDKKDKDVVLYRNNKTIFENKKINKVTSSININKKYDINYKEYYNRVQNYIKDNMVDVDSTLIISFYLKDRKGLNQVSSIKLSLTDDILVPKVKTTKNLNQHIKIKHDVWTETNIKLVIVSIICGLLILLLIMKLCNMLIKAFYRRDSYRREVRKLLKTYSNDIVIARDGFNSLENKKVIKVSSFKELLDAKNILKKPIVYVRVNDIKSKFIVEDIESIYEYTIKDLDF